MEDHYIFDSVMSILTILIPLIFNVVMLRMKLKSKEDNKDPESSDGLDDLS